MAQVNLTESAATYLKKWHEQHPGQVFRISIKKTGCSGYSYLPTMIEQSIATDVIVKTEQGIAIYLDQANRHH